MCKLLKDASSKKNTKCAFLTKTPKGVVSAELIKIALKKFSAINIKTFSTKNAACEWLHVDEKNIIS